MKRLFVCLLCLAVALVMYAERKDSFPKVSENPVDGYFPLVKAEGVSTICIDSNDYPVVSISAGMLADDVERVTGQKPSLVKVESWKEIPRGEVLVAGTLGKNRLIDRIVEERLIPVEGLVGKWESFVVATVEHPEYHTPMLVIVGSDRRGTAYGLTSLSEAIGVSPWYWWADVTPSRKNTLYIEPGCFHQGEPSVQYRGIFINDERFGGWSLWAEKTFEKETGKVGPKTYQKVFELLLRLKGNYLWPAMHNGTKAFNSNPENARLADDYAIVMGSSHCEQMLRNNEDEWKNVGTYGDFNYITNRQTMIDYWEERVKTNGAYENIYTLGLRGIHDYPMEGARTTEERVALMQKAIDDQRDILRRNIRKPVEEVPQILCTYEEVLDAYHNGLQIPDDVTLLWSDDKHGYTRNLSNPKERERKGGAGIYYHLSYHGDPSSWIWLSPLSPSFVSTELTKAYTFGARKIWVFNVGDIKPAEKELSFAMELAWDIDRWKPELAHDFIAYWATKTFGASLAQEIADIQTSYYQLQAAGKDSHVWFINYTEEQIAERIARWRDLAERVVALAEQVPAPLKDAYFELVSYPVRGAAMLNEYQLLARRSMTRATQGDEEGALADAGCVKRMFDELNAWTHHYNNEILQGKWAEFFNWQPYHWYRSTKIEVPMCTPSLLEEIKQMPEARFLSIKEALSDGGVIIESDVEAEIPLWMEALSPIRNFSKAPADNVFCHVTMGKDSFDASATPINNVWHAPYVGPMWSKVGTLHLKKGKNRLLVSDMKSDARIDRIFLGVYPPFDAEPRLRIPAYSYRRAFDGMEGNVTRIAGLGYSDGVLMQPFDTPSFEPDSAPYVEYEIDLKGGDRTIEVRTLPTLHVYEGREARYAVQLGEETPQIFSIHTDDFSAEWRWNVLRGYSSRSMTISSACRGKQTLKIYLLDPGIVLQEILINE